MEYLETSIIDSFKISYLKNDLYVGNSLKQGIMWESWMEKYIELLYEPGTDMIDIGGYFGTNALQMSKFISPKNKIHTFEPVYYDILTKNVQDNNLQNVVQIYSIGLSNETKTIPGIYMKVFENWNFAQFSFNYIDRFERTTDTVIQLKPLDSYKLDNVSLIKIDVENYESKVLEGAIETIQKNKPSIIIEIWSLGNFSKKMMSENVYDHPAFTKTMSLLFSMGYICMHIPNTDEDFLCIHSSKKHLLSSIL
jgi:FkbM family methyltransferase